MWSQPLRSGWEKPSCALAAAMMRTPISARSRASSGRDREAERRGVDDDETVAAISDVDFERAKALDLERRVQPVGERGHVFDCDPLGLAVAALGRDGDQARRALRA